MTSVDVDAEIAKVLARAAELDAPAAKPVIGATDWLADLKAARELQHISQKRVAALIGTTQSAVSELENQSVQPSITTLARYAAAVGYRMNVSFEPLTDQPSTEGAPA